MQRFLLVSVSVTAPACAFLPGGIPSAAVVDSPQLRASRDQVLLAGASADQSRLHLPGCAALALAGAVALAAAGRARRAAESRRVSLLGGAALIVAQPAHAELPFGLDAPGQAFGSFPEAMDPKKSSIIGDKSDEKIQKAVVMVSEYNDIARKMEAKLKADPQADIDKDYLQIDMKNLYLAVSDIIEIFDEGSSSAIRLSQRNLNQQWYLMGEVVPFPRTKKGEVRPRGPIRTEELLDTVKNFISAGDEALRFVKEGKVKA